MERRPAQISLVSIVQKITNLITTLDFIQTDAVSDTIKKTTNKMYFISEDIEKIFNENKNFVLPSTYKTTPQSL